ncbi:hypothetical protein GGR53DRAFT_465986 [Hypoxylon sp. FL1150]|nr:hypothetical protein GGR53DRAFT_465986 [Hypoxylon sp. FL1150]
MARGGISASQIARWRDEVNASQTYCLCSTPSLRPIAPSSAATSSDDYPKPRPAQCLSSLPVSSISPTIWARCSYMLQEPFLEFNAAQSLTLIDDAAKTSSIVVSILSSDEPVVCSNCGEPLDPDMIDARFKERGWAPPLSDVSEEDVFSSEPPPRRRSRLSWLSRFKNHANHGEAVRSLREKIEREKSMTIPPEGEKPPGKHTLRSSLSRLFSPMKPPPLLGADVASPSKATAMYGIQSFASSSGSDLVREWLPSDSGYGRPKPNIDGVVARLGRAQKLLARTTKTTPAESRLRHSIAA